MASTTRGNSPSSSTSATRSAGLRSWFSSCCNCYNCCSVQSNSRASTSTISTQVTNPSQEIAPSASAAHAFEQVAPSTSTSARSTRPERKLPYDVFINHRGPDVKHTLAASLYNTLTGMGLRVFLDKEELELGDFLPTEIEEAMRSASLHIAIFSKNYAQSPWCLAELSFMLKTGTQIIPVFYHVQPDHVRYAKGVYADAFSRHTEKGRYTLAKLAEWKNALNNVSYNVGAIIHNEADEGSLLKNIVNRVLKVIKNVPFVVAKHPIGLDEIIKDFERTTLQCAESHSTVQIVGIWGMGGSGKTTLAKQLYNNKYTTMEKASFILDVRDAASKHQLHNKQKKLLEDLGLKGPSVDNIEEGKGILANRLRSIQVLIVLDDVDNIDQLDALVPEKDSLRWDSLIIVTTRKLEVLQCWGISSIYKMKPLSPSHAVQLFCWHAFLKPCPLEGFENLVEKFMKVSDGLPLSLKVFGGQLYGKSNKDYWGNQLQKIVRILPDDIKSKLKVSYDALDYEEKEAFLDAACFFIGQEKSSAIVAWDGSGWSGLCSWESLFNKCLVELDRDDCIRMHDHLRDLGREIANPQSPYRLWSPQQIINVDNEIQAPAQLRELVISSCSEFQRFPKSIGCLKELKKIAVIDGSKLRSLPEEFCLLQSLEHLMLNSCGELSSLPSSFADLRNLRHLDLSGCMELRRLPVSFKELTLLQHLNLYRCSELTLESDILENMIKIEYLNLSSCRQLEELPHHITNQASLRELLLLNTERLREIPVNIGQLSKLQKMRTGSRSLRSLPTSIGDLSSLISLEIYDCPKLECLPDSLGRLNLLESLSIRNLGVKSLPKSVSQLINLQQLVILWCPIGELDLGAGLFTCLEQIKLWSTEVSKISIPEGCCCGLKRLSLRYNRLLTEIEVLPTTITNIELNDCEILRNVRGIDRLVKIQTLRISECPALNELPCFAQSDFLRAFELKGCYGVKKIQGLEYCKALEKVAADTRWEEAGIESLERMERLREVKLRAISKSAIEGCIQSIKNLQKWPDETIVCTRAVPDAASLVNSFAFTNISIVDSFAYQKMNSCPSLRVPSKDLCILLCFVVNCESPKTLLELTYGTSRTRLDIGDCRMRLEEGRWVLLAVFTQHSMLQKADISRYPQSKIRMMVEGQVEGEVEKGLAVAGGKERVVEAFNGLWTFLSN
ncbi:disease resistance protein RUN1 isoform X3 [Cryptomeria japonica]|uniref:disease resistance protein RUN1 isoform X3 n=1 Tax=Cryptomeria japonica TaxID=3369 RepID=UPI0027DA839D|nr:disease resistance protein RUN1 isoform X3 [Cryptomeria japonica]